MHAVDHARIALRIHSARYRSADLAVGYLFRENVIHGVVSVRSDSYIIIALFQYVRSIAVCVVCTELLVAHVYGYRLRIGIGLESIGFGKTDQFDRRFLNAVLLVVFRIRFLYINLKHVFARISIARIGDIERNVPTRRIFILVEAFRKHGIRTFEFRIRQAVSERERNFVFIIPSAFDGRSVRSVCRSVTEYKILVPRFVISIPYIYTFLINDIFAVMRLIILAVFLIPIGYARSVRRRPIIVAEIGV